MKEKNLKIVNKLGLHARAAALLVSTSSKFSSTIQIIKEESIVDAKSIMGILMLAAACGTELLIKVEGADEDVALKAIEDLFNSGFEEGIE